MPQPDEQQSATPKLSDYATAVLRLIAKGLTYLPSPLLKHKTAAFRIWIALSLCSLIAMYFMTMHEGNPVTFFRFILLVLTAPLISGALTFTILYSAHSITDTISEIKRRKREAA